MVVQDIFGQSGSSGPRSGPRTARSSPEARIPLMIDLLLKYYLLRMNRVGLRYFLTTRTISAATSREKKSQEKAESKNALRDLLLGLVVITKAVEDK